MTKVTPIIQYKWEYKNFLEYVKKHRIEHAIIYAKALKIDRRTLANWMNQPELREAMTNCLDELAEGMKKSGSKDWRMWREYLKLLGVDDEQKIDITSGGNELKPATVIDLGGKLNAADQSETK